MQELFKGYYYSKHDFSIAPEPAGAQQSTLATTGQMMTTKPKETVENETPVLLTGNIGNATGSKQRRRDEEEIQEENVQD